MQNKKYIIIKFNFKSFHSQIFKKTIKNCIYKAKLLNINISNPIHLPNKVRRFTVLRSPHINKTAREQFELRIYHKLLVAVFDLNSEYDKKKSKILINFIKNTCSGFQLKITYKVV